MNVFIRDIMDSNTPTLLIFLENCATYVNCVPNILITERHIIIAVSDFCYVQNLSPYAHIHLEIQSVFTVIC